MSDIMAAPSTYATGAIDTATTQVNDDPNPLKGEAAAVKINGMTTAIVQIETILGTGPDLRGSTTDLVERLSIEHNPDGTQKTLIVARGGTGNTSFPQGSILSGDLTSPIGSTGTGIFGQVPISQVTLDPVWAWGMTYAGPGNTSVHSTRLPETTTVIAADQNYTGTHYILGDFTINAGVTVSLTAGSKRLVVFANGTITINGTINASACGGSGGVGGLNSGGTGDAGTDQSGGGGSNSSSNAGGTSSVLINGCVLLRTVETNTASQLNGADMGMPFEYAMGGGGGGGGAGDGLSIIGDNGGNGGGSIVLIAPRIVLGNASQLITDGANGGNVSIFGGGGGGAGNIYMRCHTFTDNGCTFSQAAGQGGLGAGHGAPGVKQILTFG